MVRIGPVPSSRSHAYWGCRRTSFRPAAVSGTERRRRTRSRLAARPAPPPHAVGAGGRRRGKTRLSWNEATKAHNSHKADQAKFLREGGNKLYPEEIGLLGDLRGKSVLHLQCNAGQDTLCIKQLGAAKVTGVDISDEAIDFARKLSADSVLAATFHRADVYDWLAEAATRDERFDIVFCSYGAIIWLSDLQTWARGFAALLKPGGRFVSVEFHPTEMMFDED